MGATSKIRLKNGSGIPAVRFRGVHFTDYQFRVDVNDGGTLELDEIPVGSIGLVAYRVSDKASLDSLLYPVSEDLGFAAVLIPNPDDEFRPFRLVGEPFVIGS